MSAPNFLIFCGQWPLTMRARVVWYRCAIGHCSVRYGVAKASPLGKLAKISDFCLMRAVLHLKYPERFGELVPG